jgi:8-oxo-dGTP pyrophosphatase MutT (NUDIX family)
MSDVIVPARVAVALLKAGSHSRDRERGFVFLGREPSGLYCFPGGFIEPADSSVDEAARRCVEESVGLRLSLRRGKKNFTTRIYEEVSSFAGLSFVTMFRYARACEEPNGGSWYDLAPHAATIRRIPENLFPGVAGAIEELRRLRDIWLEIGKSWPPQ